LDARLGTAPGLLGGVVGVREGRRRGGDPLELLTSISASFLKDDYNMFKRVGNNVGNDLNP